MRRSSDQAGFVVTEALVAGLIASLVGTALLLTIVTTSSRVKEAEARDAALRQARALLVEAAAQTTPGMLRPRGEVANMSWTRTTEPLPSAPGIEQIVVEVRWTAGKRNGATRLETYRVKPEAAPLAP